MQRSTPDTSDDQQELTGFSRRGFLIGTAGAVGGLTLGGAGQASAADPVVKTFVDSLPPVRPGHSPRVADRDARSFWWPTASPESAMIQQALPVGNGRIGALTSGDPSHDLYYVTDSSMWSGTRNDVLGSDGQFPYDTAHFGTLMMLAKVTVDVPSHTSAAVQDYRRSLDVSNGLALVTYSQGVARYRREVFASAPDDVIVVRLTSQNGGRYTGRIALAGTHGETTTAGKDAASVGLSGILDNGLRYAATVRASGAGGAVGVDGAAVTFTKCSEVTVVISGGTNYTPDVARAFRDAGADPLELAVSKAEAALRVRPDQLEDTHIADYRRLFDRMQLTLGTSSATQRSLDTWTRLQTRAATGAPDPELEADYLQYGRYLMISAARSGLPIGLQGPWLDRNDPDWMGDYHTDINLQMNYWMADRAGLGSCFDTLAGYCLSQLSTWTEVTAASFNDERNGYRNTSGKVAGWAIGFSTNIYGGSGWQWHPAGNAWLCQSLMEHWDFTQDRAYLARIYPLIKGACQFWEARLVTMTVEGKQVLVDDHDWSPEHGPSDARGITYAQELVNDLFGRYQEVAALLKVDTAYATVISGLREQLYRPRISPSSGHLEEWMSPDNLGEVLHRHLSPLIELFPGDRLHPDTADPKEVKAATALLVSRGTDSYGWANAWRAACWARLGNAETAYQSVAVNLRPSINNTNGTSPNLFDMYSFGDRSTLQIDANFGTPVAILEMLLYSRTGLIELLPALPAAWADHGKITGVGAKGGFVVDIEWSRGVATSVTVHSVGGRSTEVRCAGRTRTVSLAPGKSVTYRP